MNDSSPEWKESCTKLLEDMLKLEDAACFRGRYKAKTAAQAKFYDYLSQQGMQCEPSLFKIKRKIACGEYVHSLQVGQDVRVFLNHAISFFSSSDQDGIAASRTLHFFEKEFQKILTNQSRDENPRKRMRTNSNSSMQVIDQPHSSPSHQIVDSQPFSSVEMRTPPTSQEESNISRNCNGKRDQAIQASQSVNSCRLHIKEMWLGNQILSSSVKIFDKQVSFRVKKQTRPNIYQYDLDAEDIVKIVFHSCSNSTGVLLFYVMPSAIREMKASLSDNHINSSVITLVLHRLDVQSKILLQGYTHQLCQRSPFASMFEEVDKNTIQNLLKKSLHPSHIERFNKYFPTFSLTPTALSTITGATITISPVITTVSTASTRAPTSTTSYTPEKNQYRQSSSNAAEIIDEILNLSPSYGSPVSTPIINIMPSVSTNSNPTSSGFARVTNQPVQSTTFQHFPNQSQVHNDFITQILNESSANTSIESKDCDEDEDVIVASEKVSVKCPITQVVMKEAMLNKKCKHSYDLNGITSYLNTRKGKATQCPVSGCTNKCVEMNDLLPNVKLQNLINRKRTELDRSVVKL
ncbi:DgyrCDS7332 [Dimorphilus gyrociliatus]|uniref:E3 SUMO-protein ligase NSE2 n=1 Tax=Dimorphilus gyrociliatus TaxID=2664684 RepID=A0A7I8VQS1_9ANNE|nr:DgyrCDS7332 [Dimorphilus gyrociliatus]